MHHIVACSRLSQLGGVLARDYLEPVERTNCQRNLADNLSMQTRSPVACVLVNHHNRVSEVVDAQRPMMHEILYH